MNNEDINTMVNNLSEQTNAIIEFLSGLQDDVDYFANFLDNISVGLERLAGNDFDVYSGKAFRTIKLNASNKDLLLEGALGLSGETGEAVDIIKKYIYHEHSIVSKTGESKLSKEDRDKLIYELGDILWYTNLIAYSVGAPLSEIANKNIEKLQKRYPEGFSSEASKNRTC